jgi:hypothetical protein
MTGKKIIADVRWFFGATKLLASEAVTTQTPFVAWSRWGCGGGGYHRASDLGGTMAVTVPVRRKRKMREGESRARPWCTTERRVWGGGVWSGQSVVGLEARRWWPGRAVHIRSGRERKWSRVGTVDDWLLGRLLWARPDEQYHFLFV